MGPKKIEDISPPSSGNMQSNLQLITTMAPPIVHRVVNDERLPPHQGNRRLSRHNSSSSNHAIDQTQQKVDFIGSSKAVKHLFSLPYTQDQNVSVALHNMGNGTILLDSAEDFGKQQTLHEGNDTPAPDNRRTRAPGSGRRRQRPRGWSIEKDSAREQSMSEEEELRLAQLKEEEEERSLLTSLSLLLEEEKKQQQQQNLLQNLDDSPLHNSAVILSSNAIIVKGEENETIPSAETYTRAATPKNGGNPNDVLSANLKPPQHYLSHVVKSPTEPRQYVN